MKKYWILLIMLLFSATAEAEWETLDQGLELGRFVAGQKSIRGNSIIHVLRIQPGPYRLKLLNSSAHEDARLYSARGWCVREGLVAAINASMYQKDHLTSVSYMKSESHTNNPWLSKDKAILAFNRKTEKAPFIKLIDLQCDDFNKLKYQFGTFIQSIRMIACDGSNVWEPRDEAWSTAVIATDKSKRVLFIHVSSPYTTHDLINILKELPLNIDRAMYAEGGPQAQLYIQTANDEYAFYGMLNSGIGESAANGYEWPIPNVIGVYKAADK